MLPTLKKYIYINIYFILMEISCDEKKRGGGEEKRAGGEKCLGIPRLKFSLCVK